jgi:hypothetical protein
MKTQQLILSLLITACVSSFLTYAYFNFEKTNSQSVVNKNVECNKYRNNVTERFATWYTTSENKTYSPEIFFSTYINDCVAIFIDIGDSTTHYAILNPITFEKYFSFSHYQGIGANEDMQKMQEDRLAEFYELEKVLKAGMVPNF